MKRILLAVAAVLLAGQVTAHETTTPTDEDMKAARADMFRVCMTCCSSVEWRYTRGWVYSEGSADLGICKPACIEQVNEYFRQLKELFGLS